MVVCSLFTAVQPTFAIASEREVKFDKTNVLDDLRSSVGFDILDYPYSSADKMEIISFVEYCYSSKANMLDNYGLYIYIYNPMGKNIDEKSDANMIEMAVAYDKDGVPCEYAKLELKFCSKVEEYNYKNLFYKFKVVDKEINGKTFYDRVNSNQRRYDVSGIELLTIGESLPTEYGVGGTYLFTGYTKGYGPDVNAESNLLCEVNQLETIELDVHNTYYRTGEYEKNRRHDLTSVYFAVPNKFFEEYGKLQRIKAEWYEYETTPICITSNNTVYEMLYYKLGENTYENPTNSLQLYTGYQSMVGPNGNYDKYDWAYNCDYTSAINESCKRICYLFFARNGFSNFVLSEGTFNYYIKNYTKSYHDGYVNIAGKSYSHDLFEKELSPERQAIPYVGEDIHHKLVDFDANNTFDMLSYDETHSGWQKFFAGIFGLSPNDVDQSYKGVSPIKIVTEEDMQKSNIPATLLINKDKEDEFKTFYDKSVREGKTVVLFRFAQTDYINLPVIAYDKFEGKNLSGGYGKDTYIVRESVFMNFDVIQLTFNKEGENMVIPVVNSPIDIYNDITLPSDGLSIRQILLMVLVLLLFAVILVAILPSVVNGIIWLVSLPFKSTKNDNYYTEDKDK